MEQSLGVAREKALPFDDAQDKRTASVSRVPGASMFKDLL